jgi:NAD(P)-dependent dehydrogenase (short-subunit alcohol dehydrogenase family)
MDLQDKRALITGGTSGMGSAAALAMAEKGASVIITGRDETRGASTVEEIRAGGHDAEFIAADFSEMSEVGRVADAAGEIDVLVNCAGFAALAPTADTDEAAFDGLFQIDVKAPFFLSRLLAYPRSVAGAARPARARVGHHHASLSSRDRPHAAAGQRG